MDVVAYPDNVSVRFSIGVYKDDGTGTDTGLLLVEFHRHHGPGMCPQVLMKSFLLLL